MGLGMVKHQAIRKDEAGKKFQVIICSGKGLGESFVNSLNPSDPIILMLGATPYPGTLFVQLDRPINLKGVPYSANNSEVVKILSGSIEGRAVVIKWTERYPKNLQLISNSHLRSDLKLVDGQYSEILFASEDILNNSPEIYWLSFLQWAKTTRLANFRRKFIRKFKGNHKI